jgi:hypothetical protein
VIFRNKSKRVQLKYYHRYFESFAQMPHGPAKGVRSIAVLDRAWMFVLAVLNYISETRKLEN